MRTFETTQQIKKVDSGSMENQPLINTLNRNQYLAHQVFDNLNYAKFSHNSQLLCVCGEQIPRDEIVFNRSTRCARCQAKQTEQREILPAEKLHGKKWLLEPCRKCGTLIVTGKTNRDEHRKNCVDNGLKISELFKTALANFINFGVEAEAF